MNEFEEKIMPYLIKYFKEGTLQEKREVKTIVYKCRLLTDLQKDLIYEEMIKKVSR